MIHLIVSPYKNDLPDNIVKYQKKVFDYFNIDLIQIEFNGMHSKSMDDFIKFKDNVKWDFLTFFDVDCIPIKGGVIENAIDKITNRNTIYGNAQSSNAYPHNKVKSPPFVAPSFLNISRDIWENYKKNYPDFNKKDIFEFKQVHANPDGEISEADVAEAFTRENEKIGVKIEYAYPIRTYGNLEWSFMGGWGNKPFSFGNYTEFESGTYHNFQIRLKDKQDYFINYCKKVINEN